MKKLFNFLILAGIVFTISSCLKGNGIDAQLPQTSFTGNWTIVNDSTITQFWGLWAGRADTGINYVGKPTDHYNFLANGTIYFSENNNLDTATYIVLTHDTLEFKYDYPAWRNPAKYIITNHTSHTLTLTSAFPDITPETAYTHIINLKK